MAQYAIISLGGKQYVVKEGESLLVDRLDREEGKTFHPDVLFVGGNGDGELSPKSSLTAKVVGHELGPKVRIGKYKPKKGYKRHTGFRASLTRIEVTGIGGKKTAAKKEAPAAKKEAPAAKKDAPVPAAVTEPAVEAADDKPKGLPRDYADMTVAQITEAAKNWNRPMLQAGLAYEQAHANRKGAIAALESALAAKEEG